MSHQETVFGSDCLNSTAARFIISRGSSVTKFLATFNITVGLKWSSSSWTVKVQLTITLSMKYAIKILPRDGLLSFRLRFCVWFESYLYHCTRNIILLQEIAHRLNCMSDSYGMSNLFYLLQWFYRQLPVQLGQRQNAFWFLTQKFHNHLNDF